MERTYRHLIKSERDEIYRLLTGGISHREIARRLGRSASTISREIKRNKQPLGYLPDTAQDVASKRRRRGYFKIDRYPVLKSALLEGLAKRWSPEQIAAFCYGKMTFCHETIYRYIYHSPWAIKFDLSAFLWREKPRRTKRRWRKSRSKIKDRISIHTRSKHIENRTHYNHWEADLMLFKSRKNNLITAVERKSRYLLIVNNPDGKKAKPVAERLSDAIAPFNPKSCQNHMTGQLLRKCWKISNISSIIDLEKYSDGKPQPKSSTVALQIRMRASLRFFFLKRRSSSSRKLMNSGSF